MHLGTIPKLCPAISSQLRHVSTIGKNLVKEQYLLHNPHVICPHNMVNFGPLAAEICWRVWGTSANFNGFRVLAAFMHGITIGHQVNFAALKRGRHLYSAGRPLRGALAHISGVSIKCPRCIKTNARRALY